MMGCPPWQIPCSGKVTSWLQEEMIVMAPTATSPPKRERLLLKLMFRMLSVLSITKVEIPSPRQGRMVAASSFMLAGSSRSRVFRPLRKQSTHTALTAWLITVATAAPCTPMRNPKIRMGSRMMLQTAPTTVVIMLNLAKPWVVMNGFSPITIITKTVPRI